MMAGMITIVLTGLLRGIRTQRSLVLENLALRHQLVVLRRTVPRPGSTKWKGQAPNAAASGGETENHVM
jgi:hypothetical protein